MKKESYNLAELMFMHKTKQEIFILNEGKYMTGELIGSMKDFDKCLSSLRTSSHRMVITLSGAIKLLDHLFMSDTDAAMYIGLDEKTNYIEFVANEKTYHLFCDGESVYVAEPEIGARFNKLFAHLAMLYGTNEVIKNSLVSLNNLTPLPSHEGDIDVLKFVDEFWYAGSGNKDIQDLTVNEDCDIMEHIKMAFITEQFSPERKIGKRKSEYESLCPSKEMPKKKSSSREALWEDIKSGKYILDYEWDEEQKQYITPLEFLNEFIPDDHFYNLFEKFNSRLDKALARVKAGEAIAKASDAINIFLTGKPGTGKTYLLYALSAAKGVPICSVPLSKNSEEDVFEGMSKVIDGEITSVSTLALKNAKKGGITAIEEINLADAGVVMGSIGQFLVFPYILMEQGYNPIRRHPLNIICATFNVGTAGSREINEALSSRFPQTYIIDDPTKEAFIERLVVNGHADERKMCEWVYQRYASIVEALESPDYNCPEYTTRLTFRACLGALDEIDEGIEPKSAIKHALIGKIAEVDKEVANQLYSELIEVAVAAPIKK